MGDRVLVHFYRDGSNPDGNVYVAVLHLRTCYWVRRLNIVAGIRRRTGTGHWYLYDSAEEARDEALAYLDGRTEPNRRLKERPEGNCC